LNKRNNQATNQTTKTQTQMMNTVQQSAAAALNPSWEDRTRRLWLQTLPHNIRIVASEVASGVKNQSGFEKALAVIRRDRVLRARRRKEANTEVLTLSKGSSTWELRRTGTDVVALNTNYGGKEVWKTSVEFASVKDAKLFIAIQVWGKEQRGYVTHAVPRDSRPAKLAAITAQGQWQGWDVC